MAPGEEEGQEEDGGAAELPRHGEALRARPAGAAPGSPAAARRAAAALAAADACARRVLRHALLFVSRVVGLAVADVGRLRGV